MFSMVSSLDLNTNEILKQPYGLSATTRTGCGPCKSSPIVCEFSLNRTGFVPGESIVFDVIVDNQKSSRQVQDVTVTLLQKIRYQVKASVKKCFRRAASLTLPKTVAPRTLEKWSSHIIIPPLSASTNGKCRIVDVYYSVVCEFATESSSGGKLIIPITIGTKPFIDAKSNATMASMRYEMCHFEPTRFVENIKGEIVESDVNSFKPYYPYKLEA